MLLCLRNAGTYADLLMVLTSLTPQLFQNHRLVNKILIVKVKAHLSHEAQTATSFLGYCHMPLATAHHPPSPLSFSLQISTLFLV